MISGPAEILAAFSCDSSVTIQPLGQGNINATYLISTSPKPIVLQRLSADVFPDPAAVIENFEVIYKHLQRVDQSVRAGFVMAEPVYTRDGGIFFKDKSGGYWRGQRYLETTPTSRLCSTPQARSVGRTLAEFHLLFEDLSLDKIQDPLPGFHHLSLYLKAYDRIKSVSRVKSNTNSLFCHQTIEKHREQASCIERARDKNRLSLQPIHGDPKIDNFIFNETGEAVGLLDLDTVGAGLVYHDLGDCLRSACSTSLESASENVQPGFNLGLCEAILEGYFSLGKTVSPRLQPSYIFDGLFAICFELGVRFFTDHLQGNIYFKVKQEGENLQKALNQFRLCLDILRQESEIKKLGYVVFRKL